MPATFVRIAGNTVFAILIACLITPGGLGLLAAEDGPLDMPPLAEEQPPLTEEQPPLTEEEAALQPPPGSDYLGLLESNEATYVDTGAPAGCDECTGSGACNTWAGYGDDACYDPTYCESPGQLWFRADYMLWWTRGARLPPLVTTSPVGAPVGVLGAETTTVLLGDSMEHEGSRSNLRGRIGYWFGYCEILGLEGDYFDLGQPTAEITITSR